jgi:hypothetical protein
MLSILVILLLIGCFVIMGVVVAGGIAIGAGAIAILMPIMLDVLFTIMILKFIFGRKKKSKNKKLRVKGC